jgi:hypothetical protein
LTPPLKRLPGDEDEDNSLSVGCRYDITQNLAFKAQWDRMGAGAKSKTTINLSDTKGIDNAFTVAVDWMF